MRRFAAPDDDVSAVIDVRPILHMQHQFAAHSERVTGRQLVLYVVLDLRLQPIELKQPRILRNR